MKKFIEEIKILMRNIPGLVIGIFFVSVVCMNILANKTIVNLPFLAIDGGIVLGWVTFLCMDVVTIHFGPRASTYLSISAILCNLFVAIIFKIIAIIPTPDDFSAFNSIIGGTWFILLGSTIASIVSSITNNSLNYLIGRFFKKKSILEYMSRSYISTFVSQFIDNLTFSIIVFMFFAPIYWNGFRWTLIQSVNCSLFGAIVELVVQVIFSPIGYKIVQKWEKDEVGKEYVEYKKHN